MKNLIKLFLMITMSFTLIQAAVFDKDSKYKSTKVHLSSDKPITTGNNIFNFKVMKNNKVVDGEVNVKVFMPSMPGMPAMEYKAKTKNLGNGNYQGLVNFSMSGTWQIHIFIVTKNGKKLRVKTSINI